MCIGKEPGRAEHLTSCVLLSIQVSLLSLELFTLALCLYSLIDTELKPEILRYNVHKAPTPWDFQIIWAFQNLGLSVRKTKSKTQKEKMKLCAHIKLMSK